MLEITYIKLSIQKMNNLVFWNYQVNLWTKTK